MIYIIVILIIILILSIIKLLFNFDHFSNKKIDNILKDLSNNKNKSIVRSVDHTYKNYSDTGDLDSLELKHNGEMLIDKYINTLITGDYNNPNKILEDKKNKLPNITDYNLKDYNHKLNIMKIQKEIQQDFILSMLKSQLLKLKNKTLNIESMKKIN